MKILFLTPRLPFPPRKGDQVVAYHRLRTLGPRHDITLLTFVEGEEDADAEAALRPFCSRILKVPHPRWKIAWNLLSRGAWSRLPLQVLYFRSPAFRECLDGLLAVEHFDLIHGFMLRLLPYVQGRDLPVLLDCNDSMQLNIGRQVEVTAGPKRWLYQEELRRLRRYEPEVDHHALRSIFVSPIDAEASGAHKTLVLPLGVEIPPARVAGAEPIIAFSGNMGYAPNVQAVEWFVRHCWAAVRQAVPGARFRILGGNPAPSILALRGVPGVQVVGRVSDMMASLQETALSVAPMQSGSGMQFKVLEAMACGLPVITTTLGLGAIRAEPGVDLEVADDPVAFSRSVIRLLGQEPARREMGARARAFVEFNHSWEAIAVEVERCYRDCLAG